MLNSDVSAGNKSKVSFVTAQILTFTGGSKAQQAAAPSYYWCDRNFSDIIFLPRNAMHERGLCHHAVSVCLSVRLSRS